jgi:hypothetical protein
MKSIPSANSSASDLAAALAASTLEFVAANQVDGYVAAALRLHDSGKRTFALRASEEALPLGREIQARIAAQRPDANCTLEMDLDAAIARHLEAPTEDRDAVLLLDGRAHAASASLLDFVNVPTSIVAPLTEHHFQRRAVYVITVPKSGTHMLFGLLKAFNLIDAGQGQEPLAPQRFYHLLPGNSHTVARDFFSLLSSQPRGGGNHPLFVTPTLFLYRNPMDVVVSEAFYYRDATKTSLAYYYASLGLEEQLLQLIADNSLVGSMRHRMRGYLPWLRLPNTIPVSFEELVGPPGGGSLEEQLKTIWSLQLKLHVPGSPADYAAALFRPDSQTFRKGAINSHIEHFSESCYAAFGELNQDFMSEFGYDLGDHFVPGYVPRFADHYRRRPLVLRHVGVAAERPGTALDKERSADDVVYACHGYLAADMGGAYCALPASGPRPVDPRLAVGEPHVHVAPTWGELLAKLAADPLAEGDAELRVVPTMRGQDLFCRSPSPPALAAADVCGFNIVEYQGLFHCLDTRRGELDVRFDDMSGVFVAPTLDEARAYCESQVSLGKAIVVGLRSVAAKARFRVRPFSEHRKKAS